MNDIVLRALIAASVFLALLGIALVTRPHREPKRNARRECGNTIERRPNVRRPMTATITPSIVMSDTNAEEVEAAIRALLRDAAPMSSTPTVIAPAWDDVTVTGPRGEA